MPESWLLPVIGIQMNRRLVQFGFPTLVRSLHSKQFPNVGFEILIHLMAFGSIQLFTLRQSLFVGNLIVMTP